MSRSEVRQDRQVRPSDAYDDTLPAGPTLQTGAADLEDDLNALRAQLRRVINRANWYDDPAGAGFLREVVTSFDYTFSGAIDFGDLSPGNSVIGVQLVIDVPFDDAGTLVSLGLVSNPDGILDTSNVDPRVASTYGAQENFPVVGVDSFRLKVFPFASTQGAGRVVAIVG